MEFLMSLKQDDEMDLIDFDGLMADAPGWFEQGEDELLANILLNNANDSPLPMPIIPNRTITTATDQLPNSYRSATEQLPFPASSASANSGPIPKLPASLPVSSDDGALQEVKKKRSRNASQMEHNRVAQQKYRERKKMENQHFQRVIDELTLQVSLLKAVEVKSVRVESENMRLANEVKDQKGKVLELESTISNQAATIREQGQVILTQETRLKLQEQIIEALKLRLESSMADVFKEMETEGGKSEAKVPEDQANAFCAKMKEAVRAALAGAKDVEGLQEMLLQIPEEMVFKLVRHIFASCRDMWPEVHQKMAELGIECHIQPSSCAAEAGHLA